MIWLQFVASAVVIVAAATQLAKYGDVIALRTRLGGMFVGTLLLAGATSLPELLTSINAVRPGRSESYCRQYLRQQHVQHVSAGRPGYFLLACPLFAEVRESTSRLIQVWR